MRCLYPGFVMNFLGLKCFNIFLISLNIFTFNGDAFNSTDLGIICASRYGPEITPTPPLQCTALSVTTFDEKLLGDMQSIKGAMPLMVVDDRYHLFDWNIIIKDSAKNYGQKFVDLGVDAVAIDIKNEANAVPYKNPDFNSNFLKFFEDLKKEFPKMLFGFAFRTSENQKRNGLELKDFNKCVHFYILKFIAYMPCTPVDGSHITTYQASKNDILGSVKLFREAGLDTSKLIYTIDLKIRTMRDNEYEDLAYYELCSKKVSKDRYLCFNSIPDLFNKAQVCVQEKLLGIYIDNVDYDDIDGSCKCDGPDGAPIAFKGVSVIAGACCDDKADLESFKCPHRGYPTITIP